MKIKGFTLIELLAVIIILAIILAIVVPSVTGVLNKSNQSTFVINAQMILKKLNYKKVEDSSFDITKVTKDNLGDYGLASDNYSEFYVAMYNNEPYIIVVGANKWKDIKVCGTLSNMQAVSSSDYTTCREDLVPVNDYDAFKGVNKPRLAPGMTPVYWNGISWIETTEDFGGWYNYTTSDKNWANAMTTDGSLWVWIPRYAYQIATCYHLDENDCYTATTKQGGTINIKFLKNNTNIASDDSESSLTPTYSGASQTNYIVHPAFKFGSKELTGIWVSKFELSGSLTALDSIPNVASLRFITVGEAFTASRDMETNSRYGWGTTGSGIDTHMPKNIEWGVIAYLAQSAYGKGGEVFPNPSSDYITGCGSSDDHPAPSSGCVDPYTTANGLKASTSGTIYGIYDISGGAWEYAMINFQDSPGDSGLTPSNIDDKYIERYSGYSSSRYGDAIYETGSYPASNYSWYYDESYLDLYSSLPWWIRGGYYDSNWVAGAFSYRAATGAADDQTGFRAILLVDRTF